jgi:hypothetical protein
MVLASIEMRQGHFGNISCQFNYSLPCIRGERVAQLSLSFYKMHQGLFIYLISIQQDNNILHE